MEDDISRKDAEGADSVERREDGKERSSRPFLDTLIKAARRVGDGVKTAISKAADEARDAGRKMKRAGVQTKAAETLGEAQYVYWGCVPDDLVEELEGCREPYDTDRVIERRFLSPDAVSGMEGLIRAHGRMGRYLPLFEQCAEAYASGSTELALTGLCSLFDKLLSDVSGDDGTDMKSRLDIVVSCVENAGETYLDEERVAQLVFVVSLRKAVEVLSRHSDFSGPEPYGVNRHWTMHGRERRERDDLDYLKLLRMLYGVLLLSDTVSEDDLAWRRALPEILDGLGALGDALGSLADDLSSGDDEGTGDDVRSRGRSSEGGKKASKGFDGNSHTRSQRDDHANQRNPNSAAHRANANNRSNQMNPNNSAYRSSRGISDDDDG